MAGLAGRTCRPVVGSREARGAGGGACREGVSGIFSCSRHSLIADAWLEQQDFLAYVRQPLSSLLGLASFVNQLKNRNFLFNSLLRFGRELCHIGTPVPPILDLII